MLFVRLSLRSAISKPHPRKGTETLRNLHDYLCDAAISKPHPRKGTETVEIFIFCCCRNRQISKPHPRKGTETGRENLLQLRLLDFKTTSPQGDGNQHCEHQATSFHPISKPHPRKGTETFTFSPPLWNRRRHFKTTSPQGDGTHKGHSPLIFLLF